MLEIIQEQATCASMLKVLADETRLAVVQQLIDGPKHVDEINAELAQKVEKANNRLKKENSLGSSTHSWVLYAITLLPLCASGFSNLPLSTIAISVGTM